MSHLTATFMIALSLLVAGATGVRAGCDTKWTKSKYKSFRQVESEVRGQLGDVKILRVLLCGEGAGAHFQVVVLNAAGTVQNIKVAAR